MFYDEGGVDEEINKEITKYLQQKERDGGFTDGSEKEVYASGEQ